MKENKMNKLLILLAMILLAVSNPSISKADTDYILSELEENEEIKQSLTFSNGENKKVIPVTLQGKGGLRVTLYNQSASYYSMTMKLYEDEACTKKVEGAFLPSITPDKTEPQTKICAIPKEGVYYILFELSRKSEEVSDLTFTADYLFYSGEGGVLQKNEWKTAYTDYTNKTAYYKLTVPKTGYVTIQMKAADKVTTYMTVLNHKKKELSKETSVIYYPNGTSYNNPLYFAVEKGTYYIKVSCSSSVYQLKYQFDAVTDQSGNSKTNAAVLEKGGKAKKGLVLLSERANSKIDWYKVTLTKPSKISFILQGKTSNAIQMEVENTLFGNASINTSVLKRKLQSQGKFQAGTYYIKIYKNTKEYSGYYTIQVK